MYTLSLNDKEFLALAELIEQALQNMLPKWQEEDIKELRGGQLIATCVERSSRRIFKKSGRSYVHILPTQNSLTAMLKKISLMSMT